MAERRNALINRDVPADAFNELNDLSDTVTWANVPDANITESSVTQHEAALDHDALTNFVAAEHLLVGALDHDSLLNFVQAEHLLVGAIDHDSLLNFVAAEHLLVGAIDHDSLLNFLAAEHVDWAGAGAGTIHTDNYVENASHTGHVTGDGALTLVVAAITGQTALAAGLTDTDELLISDAGVIKRMDFSVLKTYIGAVTSETNDLSSIVTWANVPDANITEGSVTQHEAALTILEGQITGAAFTNWNTAYGWGDHASGGYSASAHTHDGITDTNLLDKTAAEVVTGNSWSFNPTNYLYMSVASGGLRLRNVAGTTKGYLYHNASDFGLLNSAGTWALRITNGSTATLMAGPLTVTGAVTGSNLAITNWNTAYGWGNHASPGYITDYTVIEADVTGHEAAIDHDALTNFVAGEHLLVGAIDHDSLLNFVQAEHLLVGAIDHDALLNFASNEHFTVASISITESQISDLGSYLLNIVEDLSPQLGANLDMNGKTIAGIAEANFLDKTAAETISNNWTISADSFTLNDDKQLIFGSGADMSLKFNSGANEIQFSGIGTTNWSVILAVTDTMILATANAGVALHHNGSQKFVTASDGIDVVGDVGGTTIGGITEANLLDKSATESVSGQYSFTTGIINYDASTARLQRQGTNFLSTNTGTVNIGPLGATDLAIAPGAVSVTGTLAVSGAVTGSNLAITNWNTAYGWGDHASGGYAASSINEFTNPIINQRFYLEEFTSNGGAQFLIGARPGASGKALALYDYQNGRLGMVWDLDNQTFAFTGALSVTGALTASAFGGITSANLVDKTAVETISGNWISSGTYNFQDTVYFTGSPRLANNVYLRSINAAASINVNLIALNASDVIKIGHAGYPVDVVVDLTAVSYGGITEANLVDKSAAEVVSGHWGIPSTINTQNGNYTLVLGDAGKTIHKASGGAGETITIPANASVAFPIGTLIAIQNDGGGNLNIAITTDTLKSTATGATGTQTLPDDASAVIQKVTSTLWKYSAALTGLENIVEDTTPQLGGTLELEGNYINDSTTVSLRLAAGNQLTIVSGGIYNYNNLFVRDGKTLRIYDSGNTDYASFSHNGTNFITTLTNTTDWVVNGLSGQFTLQGGVDLDIQDGAFLRIRDAGDTDYMEFSHNGTDFDMIATNTTDLNIEGMTNVRFRGGVAVIIHDGSNNDSIKINHDGADANINLTNTVNLDIRGGTRVLINDMSLRLDSRGVGGSREIEVYYDDAAERIILEVIRETAAAAVLRMSATAGGNIKWIDSQNSGKIYMQFVTASDIRIRDGYEFRIYDSTDADYMKFKHDGTSFLMTGTQTENLIISGAHLAAPSTINTQNADYTLLLLDAGKTIHKVSGGSGETITIPANASVAFPLGTLICIQNDGGGTLVVAITTDTLTWAEDNTTGSLNIADGGVLVIQKLTATTWKGAGSQIT